MNRSKFQPHFQIRKKNLMRMSVDKNNCSFKSMANANAHMFVNKADGFSPKSVKQIQFRQKTYKEGKLESKNM